MRDKLITEEFLTVSIRTIKLGKKSFTKSLLKQVPLHHYIMHKSTLDNSSDCSRVLPGIEYHENLKGTTESLPNFFLNGELLGYVNVDIEDAVSVNNFILKSDPKFNIDEDLYYHIIYINGDILFRSYISEREMVTAEIELNQIYL